MCTENLALYERLYSASFQKRHLDALLADACALAAEDIEVNVPEQVVALEALGVIGGPGASRVVVQVIVKGIVQGPTLVVAVTAASRLGVIFPTDTVLAFLRHPDPLVRAPACSCVRAAHKIIATLVAMLGGGDREVAIAAACALRRTGRGEARGSLKRCLIE